jgi:hypothetical protein
LAVFLPQPQQRHAFAVQFDVDACVVRERDDALIATEQLAFKRGFVQRRCGGPVKPGGAGRAEVQEALTSSLQPRRDLPEWSASAPCPTSSPNLLSIEGIPGRSNGGTRRRDDSCTFRRSPVQSDPVIKIWADAHANLPARARWIAKADVAL